MKAIEMYGYGGVDQLHYDDVPIPKPGPNEILVKVGAASVNPIDWKIRRGDLKAMMPIQFPAIPGRDFAGEVVEVGLGVSNFKPGQKVMGVANQTYAEYVSVPSANVTIIPDGLGLEEAGALPLVATTGSELIDRIAPKRGEILLVTGALGSVGRAAVYAAKQRGARVIAGVRESQKKAAASIADQVVALDKDSEITSLPQLDAIADTVDGEVIRKLIPKLKPGGVLGSVLGKPKAAEGKDIRVEAIVAQPNSQNLGKLAEAARKREFNIPIAKRFKLSQAADAQKLAEQGKADGKIVLIP